MHILVITRRAVLRSLQWLDYSASPAKHAAVTPTCQQPLSEIALKGHYIGLYIILTYTKLTLCSCIAEFSPGLMKGTKTQAHSSASLCKGFLSVPVTRPARPNQPDTLAAAGTDTCSSPSPDAHVPALPSIPTGSPQLPRGEPLPELTGQGAAPAAPAPRGGPGTPPLARARWHLEGCTPRARPSGRLIPAGRGARPPHLPGGRSVHAASRGAGAQQRGYAMGTAGRDGTGRDGNAALAKAAQRRPLLPGPRCAEEAARRRRRRRRVCGRPAPGPAVTPRRSGRGGAGGRGRCRHWARGGDGAVRAAPSATAPRARVQPARAAAPARPVRSRPVPSSPVRHLRPARAAGSREGILGWHTARLCWQPAARKPAQPGRGGGPRSRQPGPATAFKLPASKPREAAGHRVRNGALAALGTGPSVSGGVAVPCPVHRGTSLQPPSGPGSHRRLAQSEARAAPSVVPPQHGSQKPTPGRVWANTAELTSFTAEHTNPDHSRFTILENYRKCCSVQKARLMLSNPPTSRLL